MQQTLLPRAAALAWLGTAAFTLAGCELAVGSRSAEARADWSRDYAVTGEARFELVNTNGRISVEPSGDAQVHVRAEKIVKAATEESAKQMLAEIEIVEGVEPNRIRLETRRPKRGAFGGGSVEVRYTVQVPSSVAVEVDNTNGGVQLRDLQNAVDAETTNGGIGGEGLRGSLRAQTTNGGISLDVAGLGAEGLDLTTTNGGVSVKLPADTKADISVRCTNGGINVGDLKVDATESSRRRLEGRLNGGGPMIKAETTNGGITLAAR